MEAKWEQFVDNYNKAMCKLELLDHGGYKLLQAKGDERIMDCFRRVKGSTNMTQRTILTTLQKHIAYIRMKKQQV